MVAIDGFAFLGAQHLLTVGRPEGLAANLADLLTEGVLSLFGKAFLLFFCLLMGFCAVSIAKPLPCAVRIKLLTALFAVLSLTAGGILLLLPATQPLGAFRWLLGAPLIIASGLFIAWREHRRQIERAKDIAA